MLCVGEFSVSLGSEFVLFRTFWSEFGRSDCVLCVGDFGLSLGECVFAACRTECCWFGGVRFCCVLDNLLWIWGSEFVLYLGLFVVVWGSECVLCVDHRSSRFVWSEFVLFVGQFEQVCGE